MLNSIKSHYTKMLEETGDIHRLDSNWYREFPPKVTGKARLFLCFCYILTAFGFKIKTID